MKKIIALAMCGIMLLLCFTGCSSAKMTEENVTDTVNKAFTALYDFNTKDLKKYIDSPTLNTIITYADKKEQFRELGKAIFANLQYEIKDIDLENETVTLIVRNKKLDEAAKSFATRLKSNYNALQLLTKLNDDNFLNSQLSSLKRDIDNSIVPDATIEITLKVNKGKRNLVLSFDETSEDAVSGGALSSIKFIYGLD